MLVDRGPRTYRVHGRRRTAAWTSKRSPPGHRSGSSPSPCNPATRVCMPLPGPATRICARPRIKNQMKQFVDLAQNLYRMFDENGREPGGDQPVDRQQAEGDLLALDAKINIDDNALFRQPETCRRCAIQSQEDEMERDGGRARPELRLAGRRPIACMVNGAGLAMATMDLIKLHGGRTGQLPRCRRRRDTGKGRGGLQADPVQPGRDRDPRQHLRRHRAL